MRRLLLVTLGLALATLGQVYCASAATPTDAIALYAIAGVFVAAGIGRQAWPGAATPTPAVAAAPAVVGARSRGYAALAAALALGLAGSAPMARDWSRSLADGAALLGLALLLAAYGFSRVESWSYAGNLRALLRSMWQERWATLALAAIVLFGAWMRLGRLDYYPPPDGIGFVDEAQVGKIVVDIVNGQRPWMFLSLVYPGFLSFKLLGMSLLALRLPVALYGAAMTIPFYLLARLLVPRAPALAATLLFAASRWDATVSRNVLAVIPESFIGLMAFYFLYRALRTGGGMSYALAGVFAMLGMYGYAGFRVVPVIVALLALLALVSAAWRALRTDGEQQRIHALAALTRTARGMGVTTAAALITVLPYLGLVARDPHNAFFERFTSVMPAAASGNWLAALPQYSVHLQKALLLFNYRGDSSAMFNIPGMPMLDPITGVVFALALVCSLLYVWKGHTALPVLWFWLTLIGGAVLTGKQEIYRITGLTPAIYLLVALLLAGLWQLVQQTLTQRQTRVLTLPAVALLILAAGWNAHLFFDVQINRPNVRREYLHATELAAAYIARQPDKPYVHLFSNTPFYEPGMDFAWLAGFPRGARERSLAAALPHRVDSGPVLYVFAPPYLDGEIAAAVRAYYPGAACEQQVADWGEQFFVACRVEASDVKAQQGLAARYYAGGAIAGEPAALRNDAALDLTWAQGDAPFDGVFSAEWQGALYIAGEGSLTLGVDASAPFSVTIDGLTWSTTGTAERSVMLYQGWHAISARLTGGSAGAFARLYRLLNGARTPLSAESYASFPPVYGLLGRYYAGGEWRGQPVLERLEPMMDVYMNPESPEGRPSPALPDGPLSAEWTARFQVEADGQYRFRAYATSGQTELAVDGQVVARTDVGDYNQTVNAEGQVALASGSHVLRVRYSYKRGYVARAWAYWAPLGQPMGHIDYQLLTPLTP